MKVGGFKKAWAELVEPGGTKIRSIIHADTAVRKITVKDQQPNAWDQKAVQ